MDLQHINRAAIAIAEANDLEVSTVVDQMKNTTVWLIVDDSIQNSRAIQISYLTSVNIAHRVFLGGVKCKFPIDTPNLLGFGGESFSKVVESFNGKIETSQAPKESDVKLLFGIECFDDHCLEVISSGWRGGINMFDQNRIILNDDSGKNSLGAVAAASIACYTAFCMLYKLEDARIILNTGISLWNLNAGKSWFLEENDGPQEIYLPKKIWTLGLGHLGQAYLWTVAMMDFKNPKETTFLLQDFDEIGDENLGSQILSFDDDVEQVKTRPCMRFLENIGFKTRLIEKPREADDSQSGWVKNFPFLLNGVDNIPTRRGIDNAQIGLFLDGATNGQLSLFDSFTMKNATRIDKSSDELWRLNENDQDDILHPNLTRRLQKEGKCGVLANYGISTPFIGVFSASIVVAEMIRSINKGTAYSIVSLQLRDLGSINAVENGQYGLEFFRNAI